MLGERTVETWVRLQMASGADPDGIQGIAGEGPGTVRVPCAFVLDLCPLTLFMHAMRTGKRLGKGEGKSKAAPAASIRRCSGTEAVN